MRTPKLIVLLIFIACTASEAQAQFSSGRPGAFLRLGVSARALAVGGAFTAVADDPSAAYWNAAGLAQLDHLRILASNQRMSLDRSFNFIGAAMPVGYSGSLGLSWIGLAVSGIEGRSGNTSDPDFIFSNSENALLLSYAHRVTPFFYAGVNLKMIYQKLHDTDATGGGFDASLLLLPTENIRIGLAVQDIKTRTRWSNNFQEVFPMTYRAGISFKVATNLLLAIDAYKVKGDPVDFAWGAEYKAINRVPLRLGYQKQGFVGGGGFEIPMRSIDLSLDYAYGRDRLDGSESHKITVGIAFGKTAGSKKVRVPESDSDGFFEQKVSDFPLDSPKSNQAHEEISQRLYAEITARALNVRAGPGIKFKKLGIARKGRRFRIVERRGAWYKIAIAGGRFGWVYHKYVKEIQR